MRDISVGHHKVRAPGGGTHRDRAQGHGRHSSHGAMADFPNLSTVKCHGLEEYTRVDPRHDLCPDDPSAHRHERAVRVLNSIFRRAAMAASLETLSDGSGALVAEAGAGER